MPSSSDSPYQTHIPAILLRSLSSNSYHQFPAPIAFIKLMSPPSSFDRRYQTQIINFLL
jgi:hypothetical protein